MARLKADAVRRPEPREVLRRRVAARVAEHNAQLAAGVQDSWDGPADFEHLAGYDRSRLAALEAGEPVTVGRWELPGLGITDVPALAWAYQLHADGRLTVLPEEGGSRG